MMLEESDPVPLVGIRAVEREGSGKKVSDAWLTLEERHGPTPPRRVVSIETRDGAVYRFQRHAPDEYLSFYDRENPDGSEFQRASQLPAHVEAVREAIVSGRISPAASDLQRALETVGERESDETPDRRITTSQHRVATDGGAARRVRTLSALVDVSDEWPDADEAVRLTDADALGGDAE